jgi:hypothetical protein
MNKDTKLDWHVDDSDVTLNVCLGKRFEGGDLVFSGTGRSLHSGTTTGKGADRCTLQVFVVGSTGGTPLR